MRGRLPDIPAIGRAAGFALVAAAVVAATLHFREDGPRSLAAPAAASGGLAEELQRCQVIGVRAEDDSACEAAWTESRRRFLTYDPTPRNAASAPASQKSSGR